MGVGKGDARGAQVPPPSHREKIPEGGTGLKTHSYDRKFFSTGGHFPSKSPDYMLLSLYSAAQNHKNKVLLVQAFSLLETFYSPTRMYRVCSVEI